MPVIWRLPAILYDRIEIQLVEKRGKLGQFASTGKNLSVSEGLIKDLGAFFEEFFNKLRNSATL